MTVVYDGTFEGFLTIIYEYYYSKLAISNITKDIPHTLFNDDIKQLETQNDKAQKVLEGIKNKFNKKYFETIVNIFMCDSAEFEMDLFYFIITGFKDQSQLNNINHTFIFNIQNLQKELFRINHKMTGFVRFQELDDGTLYATIDVKFNIIYFLGKHFTKRFNNQNFIIHDLKRELAFVYNEHFKGVQNVASFKDPTISKDEQKFQKLWQTFFDSVAIESRENKNLQRQMVPLIYRTYMNEFN